MKHSLILVSLSKSQIEKAKKVNGPRKQITHALLCGPYGQLFGTEMFCRKYFDAWNPKQKVFPSLFYEAVEMENWEIQNFKSTFNLVMRLIEAQDNAR